MTLDETMALLERHHDPKLRGRNYGDGALENQSSVKMGDLRAIAKAIKVDHDLGLKLWATGDPDAMILATFVMKPKQLSEAEVERMVTDVTFSQLADYLNSNVVKLHPAKEELRNRWMSSGQPMLSRAAWSLTTERVTKSPDGLDLSALLDRIEREMSGAPGPAQWTMNYCLAEIGIRNPALRERAVGIGEKLGVFRNYPVSKGCVSPFAPIWIREMVARQG